MLIDSIPFVEQIRSARIADASSNGRQGWRACTATPAAGEVRIPGAEWPGQGRSQRLASFFQVLALIAPGVGIGRSGKLEEHQLRQSRPALHPESGRIVYKQ